MWENVERGWKEVKKYSGTPKKRPSPDAVREPFFVAWWCIAIETYIHEKSFRF